MAAAFVTNAEALAALCRPLYAAGEAERDLWLGIADSQLSAGGWGDQRPVAVALLAAHQWHRLTGGSQAGLSPTAAEAVGQVSTETASVTGGGNLSRSYDVLKGTDPDDLELHTTRYGAAFVRIRNQCPDFGPRIVRVA